MGANCCRPDPIDFSAEPSLFHFFLLRSVGKGSFGKVRVIQHKSTKTLFALKYINKEKCVRMKAVPNVVQERRLLEEVECPFVCCLRYAFQDDENCFFVLDLMLGGDLRFHLDRTGGLSEETVRFYMSELALGIEYLHSRRIVHRDLKPDNILLDERGHVHITDFNIAVHFSERRLLTGVAGSLAYMAPEVLSKRGYSSSIDWWSLGIVAFELVFGKRPFRGKTNQALSEAIMGEELVFPENAGERCSREGMAFIRGLLERDPAKRFGARAHLDNLHDFKSHPWFAGVDWDAIYDKETPPPFVPDNKKANFDATHELEELLLEENPLKARKRKVHKGGKEGEGGGVEGMSKEMRMMEDNFTVFDYTKSQRQSYYRPKPKPPNGMHPSNVSSSLSMPPAAASSHSGGSSNSSNIRTLANLAPYPNHPNSMSRVTTLTMSERTQLASTTGMDIEAQIQDGGGVAVMRRTQGQGPGRAAAAASPIQKEEVTGDATSHEDSDIKLEYLKPRQ